MATGEHGLDHPNNMNLSTESVSMEVNRYRSLQQYELCSAPHISCTCYAQLLYIDLPDGAVPVSAGLKDAARKN